MSAGESSHLLGSQLLPMHCLWIHLGAELCFHVGPMGTFASFFKDSLRLLFPGHSLSLILHCSLFWAALYFPRMWVLKSYLQMCCNLSGLGAINA